MEREASLNPKPAQYRELLLAKRSEVLAEIDSKIPRLRESAPLAEDDQAPVSHDQFIALEVQRRCYRSLKEIDAALDRLATGDYGTCMTCGKPISPKRLLAIPWAAHCIRCQEGHGEGTGEPDERAA